MSEQTKETIRNYPVKILAGNIFYFGFCKHTNDNGVVGSSITKAIIYREGITNNKLFSFYQIATVLEHLTTTNVSGNTAQVTELIEDEKELLRRVEQEMAYSIRDADKMLIARHFGDKKNIDVSNC